MRIDTFMKEIQSIENPVDRKAFLSMLTNQRMVALEKAYRDKSLDYLSKLQVEVKTKDLKSITKMLAQMAKTQSRLLIILDNLIDSIDKSKN